MWVPSKEKQDRWNQRAAYSRRLLNIGGAMTLVVPFDQTHAEPTKWLE
jgi:hypothetical protein